MKYGLLQLQPAGQVQGAAGFLVGVDDSAGAPVGPPNRCAAAVRRGVRLPGEVGEDVRLVARGRRRRADPPWW